MSLGLFISVALTLSTLYGALSVLAAIEDNTLVLDYFVALLIAEGLVAAAFLAGVCSGGEAGGRVAGCLFGGGCDDVNDEGESDGTAKEINLPSYSEVVTADIRGKDPYVIVVAADFEIGKKEEEGKSESTSLSSWQPPSFELAVHL